MNSNGKPTSWRGYVVLALDFVDDRVLRHRFHSVCKWLGNHPWWLFVPLQPAIVEALRSIVLELAVSQDPSIEDVVLDANGVVVDVVRTAREPERTLYLLPDNKELN